MLWETDRNAYFAELRRFAETANRAAATKKDSFVPHLERGPQAKLDKSRERLASLDGVEEHPVVRQQPQAESAGLGMCGQLYTILKPEIVR